MIYITFDNNTLETTIEARDSQAVTDFYYDESKYVEMAKMWSLGTTTPIIDLFTVTFDNVEMLHKITDRRLMALITWSQPGYPKSDGLDATMKAYQQRADEIKRRNHDVTFSYVQPSGYGLVTECMFDGIMDVASNLGYRIVL